MRPPGWSGKNLAVIMFDYAAEIRRRFGNVRRARGCWLYTEKNVRLLDMFLDGGAAILGRRRGSSKLALKNMIDRGLTGSLPSGMERNLSGAVSSLFGAAGKASWFCSRKRAVAACSGAGIKVREWFPWIPSGMEDSSAPGSGESLITSVPFPWGAAPEFSGVIVFFPDCASGSVPAEAADNFIPETSDSLEVLPDARKGDSVPPQMLSAFARAFFDLRRRIPLFSDGDFAGVFSPRENSPWIRRGAYLFLRQDTDISKDRYYRFFCDCLDRGILISPSMEKPSVIPLMCADSPQEKLSIKTSMGKIPDFVTA